VLEINSAIDFVKLAATLNLVLQLALLGGFTAGLIFFFIGWQKLKEVASVGFRSGQGVSTYSPFLYWVSGLFLIYYPTTLAILDTSLLDQNIDSLAYFNQSSSVGSGSNAAAVAVGFLYEVMGTFAIMRGVAMLRGLGATGYQPKEGKSLLSAIAFIFFGYLTFFYQETFSMIGDYIPIVGTLTGSAIGGLGAGFVI